MEGRAILDLNGHTLNVKGDFRQYSNVNINSGSLKIDGNYLIDEEGLLQMTNESDYVYVEGDFVTCSGDRTIESDEYYLTAGVMEVKGDFICTYNRETYSEGCYVATGSHKVILSGDKEQTVNNDSGWLVFNELEIINENGVKFTWFTPINLMKGNYKVIDDAYFIIGKIAGDVVIDGNLVIVNQEVDLAGHDLTINGNLNQYFADVTDEKLCKIKINGGRLIVEGNYTIGYDTNGKPEQRDDGYSTLEMTNENDYVFVGGDFIVGSGDRDLTNIDNNLTAGVMEVKGNFYCKTSDWKRGRYIARENHKVILSGDKEQEVYDDSGWLLFNELEIKNENGVKFTPFIPVAKMKGHYKILDESILRIESIVGDVVIDGNLTIIDNEIDLNGYNLTINGDLNQYSVGRLYSSDDKPFLTKIKINGGSLKVNGNYTIGYLESDRIYAPGSIIEMTNEKDYVYVEGNFSINSEIDHTDYLTAGTLEVKGDFTQSSSPLNFVASGTHKTILSGDSVQTITFEYPETSSFNILKLTKPLDTGYIFNTTPVWKSLEE